MKQNNYEPPSAEWCLAFRSVASPCHRTTLPLRSKTIKISEVKAFFGELAPCSHHGRRYKTRMERSGPRGVPKVRSKVQPRSMLVPVAVPVVVVVLVVDAGQPVPDQHHHLSPLRLSNSSEGRSSESRRL